MREHNKQTKKLFVKILLTVWIILTICIITLTPTLFFIYKGSYTGEFSKHDQELLLQIEHYYTDNYNSLRKMGAILLTDPDFQKLIYEENFSAMDLTNLLKRARNKISVSPYIISANFYFPDRNYYYSTFELKKVYGNILELIPQEYTNNTTAHVFQPIPTKITLNPSLKFNPIVTTVNIFLLPLSQQENAPLLVLYANTEAFSAKLQEITEDTIIIYNAIGDIIAHSDASFISKNISDTPLINIVSDLSYQTSTDQTSVFLTKIQKSSIITALRRSNYTLIKISSTEEFIQHIRKIQILTFNYSLAILGCFFVIYFFTMRKLYSPIQHLISRIRQINRFNNEANDDIEMMNFMESSTTFLEHFEQLSEFKIQNLNIARSKFFETVLKGNFREDSVGNYEELITSLDIQFSIEKFYKVIILTITGDTINYYSKILIRSVINQHFNKKYSSYTYINSDNKYVSIIGFPSMPQVNSVLSMGEGLKHYLVSEIDIPISAIANIIISPTYSSFTELKGTYKQLQPFIDDSYHHKTGSVISEKSLRIHTGEKFQYPFMHEESVKEHLKNQKIDTARVEVKAFFKSLQNFSYTNCVFSINRFFSAIINTLQHIEETSHISFETTFSNYYREINEAENIYAVMDIITKILNKAEDKFLNYKNEKISNHAQFAKTIIDDNFRDPNLNVKIISDKINLTPAYTGQIFRKYISKSISEYLLHKRLEEAKKILQNDTHKKIIDIAKDVGIDNFRYFYSKFKLVYGVTPGQFREGLKTENYSTPTQE